VLTIAGTQLEATPTLYFQPVVRRDDGQTTFMFQLAVMKVLERSQPTEVPAFASGITMDTFPIQAGHSYRVGASLSASPNAIEPGPHGRPVGFALSWICQYGLSPY